MVAADFAVDAAGFAPLVIHHGQLRGRGVGGGALRGSAPGFSDDGGVGVPQQGLGEVRLLQHLAALVDDSEQRSGLEQLTLIKSDHSAVTVLQTEHYLHHNVPLCLILKHLPIWLF